MPIEHCLGAGRYRKIQRFFRHFNVTILCLFLTILVLRGTFGAGKFGTPEQDFIKIRNHFHRQRNSDVETRLSPPVMTNNYGPKLSNWDEERKTWLRKNPNTIGQNKPRVLLITDTSSPDPTCENIVGRHNNDVLSRSIQNKIDYCRLNGIEILYNQTLIDSVLVRNLLISHPEVEFIWWMDNYTLFPDMPLEIPWAKYKDHNLVIYDWDEDRSCFLLRNSQWALDIMNEWAIMGSLKEVLAKKREEIINLGNKVYVEKNSYYLKDQIKCRQANRGREEGN